jgi:hypothetical protein
MDSKYMLSARVARAPHLELDGILSWFQPIAAIQGFSIWSMARLGTRRYSLHTSHNVQVLDAMLFGGLKSAKKRRPRD